MVIFKWLAMLSPVLIVLGIALGYAASRVHPRYRFGSPWVPSPA